jgi:hypothetical protein
MMVISAEIREEVRRRFAYCCGYCGVHENEAGSALEVDHFQPRSKGGTDELDNLIYCCSACNKFKQGYWPSRETQGLRLLHPLRDKMADHLMEESDGRISALSETGVFHLARLRLNRPQLIQMRLKRQLQNEIYSGINAVMANLTHLDQSEDKMTDQLKDVWASFGRLRNL